MSARFAARYCVSDSPKGSSANRSCASWKSKGASPCQAISARSATASSQSCQDHGHRDGRERDRARRCQALGEEQHDEPGEQVDERLGGRGPAAGPQRREGDGPFRGVEYRREGRQAIAEPGEEQGGGHGVPQEPREGRFLQAAARARDREREHGPEEGTGRVGGEVREARDAARLVELGELDGEGEGRGEERRAEDGEGRPAPRVDQPGEAGAEGEVQQDVRGDVAARRPGPRQLREPLEGSRAGEREAERVQRSERDQEDDRREQPAGDAPVVRDHALTRGGPRAAGPGSPRRAARGNDRAAGARARASRARRARGSSPWRRRARTAGGSRGSGPPSA
jgi:hypothetical protein